MFHEYHESYKNDRYGLKECSLLLSAGFVISLVLSLGLSLS